MQMMVLARQAFITEVSHRKCDDAVSLAKVPHSTMRVLLYKFSFMFLVE